MIDLLPAVPDPATDLPADFSKKAAAMVLAQKAMVPQLNSMIAGANTLAAGGAYAIPYFVDLTSTADADPTAGLLRFNAVAQNTATMLYADLVGSDGVDYTTILDQFDASTSAVKGQLRIVKQGDPTKFLMFNVMGRTTVAGYRKLVLVPTGGTSASPFGQGDPVLLKFQRTGDIGPTGTALRRPAPTVTNPASITPNITNFDNFAVIGQAQGLQIVAPSGALTDGRTIAIRVKDNGTARALAFDTIYRGSSELPLPAATIAGKVTYMGFQYNADDAKWDLLAMLQTM